MSELIAPEDTQALVSAARIRAWLNRRERAANNGDRIHMFVRENAQLTVTDIENILAALDRHMFESESDAQLTQQGDGT